MEDPGALAGVEQQATIDAIVDAATLPRALGAPAAGLSGAAAGGALSPWAWGGRQAAGQRFRNAVFSRT